MNKRIAAAILWLIAGWYLGAMIAYVLGVSDALGPILGTAFALIIAGDPRGIIWKKSTVETQELAPERLPQEPGLGEVLASR